MIVRVKQHKSFISPILGCATIALSALAPFSAAVHRHTEAAAEAKLVTSGLVHSVTGGLLCLRCCSCACL